ncbi:MAG: DNA-3-methyladenine glycosylase 2 family protein [Acidimicrobiales bacterium]
MIDDFEACYRAVSSRDARFDGWFFTGVTSTGIYCRPSCPAITPQRKNVRFFASAGAAQQAGFRACKRCRPDASPGSPEWDTRADVVGRAMRLIADGVVDRDGVGGLAARLGYSVRQLQRLLLAEVGAPPLALARAQRAQQARVLIETTDLPFAHVAFGAGFASIRQFNDTVRDVFASSPSQLRAKGRLRSARPATSVEPVRLRLTVRTPFHAEALFGHLAATAVPGVEEWVAAGVDPGVYRRTMRLPHGPAVVALTPRVDHVVCVARLGDLRDLGTAVARCRRLLDLDADPVAIDAVLAADPALTPLVTKTPGRRVPRTPDGDEMAMRAVLGQQVSTAGARRVTARIAAAAGAPLAEADGTLTHCFPSPAAILELDDSSLPLPARRRDTLRRLARELVDGRLCLDAGADWGQAGAALAALPGIGPWTASVIAMRALGDPDAFPRDDLGVVRGASLLGLPSGGALSLRAERWRPWRSYATQYIWGATDHPINRYPEASTCRAS